MIYEEREIDRRDTREEKMVSPVSSMYYSVLPIAQFTKIEFIPSSSYTPDPREVVNGWSINFYIDY